ncbi:hypothetical protein TraAM80_00134 [Trypanosoma rangeli]|uniref:Uncharacterized protein n=1 Tax=Trypanosoma rangeli TaxID=5698 RepID=A0A3R7P4W1_TRYRA|nr:uncharacterized protein TraAM80_00134 [Trypanosoma rangeli]RNF12779.1 hypothetical protein TraAM80_00134 [Trypanosoma rangeli]|eukprot:RNF12779.1 hypothetical protein TraAM80_00134 [Trypanosoma rangeli]
MSNAERKRPLPRAFAELSAHFLPARGDILTSATITVEFAPVNASGCTDGGIAKDGDTGIYGAALLVTLSHLHEIREVRVWLERKGGVIGDSVVGEWRQLQLNASTLYEAKRRAVRYADSRMQSSSSSKPPTMELTSLVATEQKITCLMVEEENGDDEGDGVLELVFGSSDDENNNSRCSDDNNDDAGSGEVKEHRKSIAEAETTCVVPEEEGCDSNNDEDDSIGTHFILKLWPCAADGTSATDEVGWFMSRCCIEVGLLPPSRLASLAYPRLTVSSLVKKTHPEHQAEYEFDNESYLLLVGQRFYDYFLCPRVAYAEGEPGAARFTAVDVFVTVVRPFQDALATSWEILYMRSFPCLPEDLICAFVKPQKRNDTGLITEEKHAGVRWCVRHHPAYTFLSCSDEDDVCGGKCIYFFHCDHVLCNCLIPLLRQAEAAWEETGSSAAVCVGAKLRCSASTWVVTGCSNTLLSLRRGTLCTRGAVVLVADLLRTIRQPITSLTSPFQVNALRAKTSVLSSALEVLWRIFAGNGVVPEFSVNSSSPALTRGWALCLLCDECGWTELLSQERRIVSVTSSTQSHGSSWWLPQRYAQETYESLIFLSSAFVIASLRHKCHYPWQLLEKRNSDAFPMEIPNDLNTTVSSGMHLSLVQKLLLQQQQSGVGSGYAAFLPSVFHALLYYEEDQKHDACRDVKLRLKCANKNFTHCLQTGGIRFSNLMWSIDVPFTVVYFAIYVPTGSQVAQAEARIEKRLQCRVAHVLHCSWRVSGLTWAKGLDQHTSFSLLEVEADGDGKDALTKKAKSKEEEIKENTELFSMEIPLLVLNPKVVPAALSICVKHDWFWSKFSSFLEALALRVLLQHIIEDAVGEGVNHVEEADLVFTPLMNQLLEDILENRCHLSFKADETSPAALFVRALQSVDVDATAVYVRIYPSLRRRFVQLVSRFKLTAPVVVSSAGKRERDDDEGSLLREGVDNVRARMLAYLRRVEAYAASLPRTKPRWQQRQEPQDGNEQQQAPQRPRLLLSLRRRPFLHQGQGQEQEQEVVKQAKKTKMVSVYNPGDVASMIGRVLTKGTEAGVVDNALLAARSAALSLVMPLWLLLHNRPGMSEAQKVALFDGAEYIYESLRGYPISTDLDAVMSKGYESLVHKAESPMGQKKGQDTS